MTNEECADAILKALADGADLDSFPGGETPAGVPEAYALQALLAKRSGAVFGAYKIAASAAAVQKMLGIDAPILGNIQGSHIKEAPATFTLKDMPAYAVECEYIFRLADDLARRDRPWTYDEVATAIGSVHIGFEVPATPFVGAARSSVAATIVAGALGGAIVVGPEIQDWQQRDLAGMPVKLLIDGAEKAEGSGAQLMDHPLNPLVWLANQKDVASYPLRSGQYVATGSMTGVTPFVPGQAAEGDFGEFGKISVSLGT